MDLKVAIGKLVDNKTYFGDFDVAGDANHDKNGDGKVSLLDVRRIASGKRFNGGTYPPDEMEIAQTILGNLKEFNGGIGNKPVFTLDDLKKFDPNAKDKGSDPVDESTSSKQRKFSLLLNVFDQLDDDKNGKIDNNDITRFLDANPGDKYKATKDALKDIRDSNLLKELDPSGSVTKGQVGDYVGKSGKPPSNDKPEGGGPIAPKDSPLLALVGKHGGPNDTKSKLAFVDGIFNAKTPGEDGVGDGNTLPKGGATLQDLKNWVHDTDTRSGDKNSDYYKAIQDMIQEFDKLPKTGGDKVTANDIKAYVYDPTNEAGSSIIR